MIIKIIDILIREENTATNITKSFRSFKELIHVRHISYDQNLSLNKQDEKKI